MTLSALACGRDSRLEDLHLERGGGRPWSVGDRASTLGARGKSRRGAGPAFVGGAANRGHAVTPLPETPSSASPPLAGQPRGGGLSAAGAGVAVCPQRPPPALSALPARSAAGAGRPSRAPRDAPGHGARRALRAARTAQDAASLPLGRPAPAPAPPRPPEDRGGPPRRGGRACWDAQGSRLGHKTDRQGHLGVRMVQVSPAGPAASVSCSARGGPVHLPWTVPARAK